jgi:hypothetical protein
MHSVHWLLVTDNKEFKIGQAKFIATITGKKATLNTE